MSPFRRRGADLEPVPEVEPFVDHVRDEEPQAPSGPYSGRLAFDSDSGFHLDPDGNRVVTKDGGQSWEYAVEGDYSHYQRYHQRYAELKGTNLEEVPEPHHYGVQPDDPHHAGVRFHPDMEAHKQTSHTDAWSENE